MNTTTTAITPRTSRLALVLLLALLVLFGTVAPALAAPPTMPGELTLPPVGPDPDPDPTGPGDIVLPEADPDPDPTGADDLTATPVDPGPTHPGDLKLPEADPRPTPSIVLTPGCDPVGFGFALSPAGLPKGAVLVLQWRAAPAGAVQTIPTTGAGFIESGEGDFQVRGTIVFKGQPVFRIDWTDVTVDCDTPEPAVTIDVAPHCEPEAGLTYDIEVVSPPDGPVAYKAQWRGDDGVVHTVDGQSGTIATGEGTFEIRGVLHHQGPGFYATDFVEVVIDCSDDTPDDLPRPGTPNFTG